MFFLQNIFILFCSIYHTTIFGEYMEELNISIGKKIYKLRKENEVLVNKNTQLYSQVKDLTGKLISATTFYPELDIKG